MTAPKIIRLACAVVAEHEVEPAEEERPSWSYPGPALLAEAREGRKEIEAALARKRATTRLGNYEHR